MFRGFRAEAILVALFGKRPAILTLAWLGAGLAGCGPAVVTQASIAPKVPEAAQLDRVSVIGFSGRRADEVNAVFEASLVNHRFNDEPYFTVVDRARTKELMREYGASLRGEIEPSTAARFGRQIGAKGVYFGDVTRADVNQRTSRGTERYCARYNSSGRKCRQHATRSVTCYDRTATVTLVPRLVDVESGQVVYRGLHTGEARSSTCGSRGGRPDNELLADAILTAVTAVLADVAPRNETVQVKLMDEPSALAAADASEFSRGLAFAKEQRMDRACQIWEDLNGRTAGLDNALLFNVAVCHEIAGDHGEALGLLEQVDHRLDLPDRNVSDALARLRATLQVQ